ncbi:MAG: type II toxin-antitoxin system Phd/YefM family antitoxin [Bacillota bacterium]|nr:type II toxin-antitoxin system Phd/YefM family antitoxin [Bacillota bacterium]
MGGALTYEDDPILFGPSQLVPSSKLSKNLGSYLERTRKRPLFVTRGGEPEAVLVGIDEYRELLREERRAEELYHLVLGIRRLVEALRDKTPLVDFDDVLARFGVTEADLEDADDDAQVDG